ncbi:MAG: transporter substrate-binding domain-containing protein [Spirochaetaceae bacterium]
MTKKLILILNILILTLTFGCKKAESELEIIEESITTQTADSVVAKEPETGTKPLVTIGLKDTLEIYVRADGAPGMYLDSDGVLKGFYVDLEKAVMDKMGQTYRLNSYSDAGPVVQKIKIGEAHSALAVPDLPDYRTFLNLSIPYEILKYVTVVRADDPTEYPTDRDEIIKSLYGKRVGVQTRGHIYQALRDYKDIILVEYPTTTVAMEALHNGEIDVVPEVKRIMQHYSKLNGWDFRFIDTSIISYDITTGFSQILDEATIKRYNTALQSLIDSGFVNNLYFSYFGE